MAAIEVDFPGLAPGFVDTSRHVKVMLSTDRTTTGQLRPRVLRSIDDLKPLALAFRYFPHKNGYRRLPPPQQRQQQQRDDGPLRVVAATDELTASVRLGAAVARGKAYSGGKDPGADNNSSNSNDFRQGSLDGSPVSRSAAFCEATRYADPNQPTVVGGGVGNNYNPTYNGNEGDGHVDDDDDDDDEELHPPFMWIDIKKPTRPERKEVLSWFPTLHALTIKALTTVTGNEQDDDQLEHFPAQGYTCMTLSGTPPRQYDDYPSIVSFVLFDHVLLTFSDGGYAGEENVSFSAVEAVGTTAQRGGVSTVFSAAASTLILQTQASVASLMIDVDQLDELVLQIQPSEMDQNDLLTRIAHMRHRVAAAHTSLLLKERVLKQLLLPTLRHTPVCGDPGCVERFQRALTLTRGAIEKLRRGRDTVNLSCMNLVSGVSSRLLMHCHWMDYLNHVQSQIALVVMPVAVIPGMWAANVSVPFGTTETVKFFWSLTAITITIMLLGLIYPIRKYFMYKPPGALVPSLD